MTPRPRSCPCAEGRGKASARASGHLRRWRGLTPPSQQPSPSSPWGCLTTRRYSVSLFTKGRSGRHPVGFLPTASARSAVCVFVRIETFAISPSGSELSADSTMVTSAPVAVSTQASTPNCVNSGPHASTSSSSTRQDHPVTPTGTAAFLVLGRTLKQCTSRF